MKEGRGTLEEQIKYTVKKFLEKSENKDIEIISHFDTDGISSAAIMIQTLKKLDKTFSVKIFKSLNKEIIQKLPKDKIILFLDLASNSFHHIQEAQLKDVFILDHHEVTQEIPPEIEIINPELYDKQKMSASCVTYLFCKEINSSNKEFAKLAVLGLIGDMMEKNIEKLNHGLLEDKSIMRKRGLLIYPSTRPLNKTLEFCSYPYIPEVTGNIKGVLELLREAGINPINGRYKSLLELDEDEMTRLITSIILRNPKAKQKDIIGDIFLLKFFNKLEDARELSAIINACSRLGKSEVAIQYCMELPKAKKQAESLYIKYKQILISGIKFMSKTDKIEGKDFVIINAENNIKDTMIGTISSIMASSSVYEPGTMIISLSYDRDKIKVSARNSGREGRNTREVLANAVEIVGGETGGHHMASGANIPREKEKEFIESLQKILEVEVVRV